MYQGLHYFFVEMRSAGNEFRQIRQFSGESNFSEVFFTDVRFKDSQRVGAVGQGWKIALTMLANERFTVGRAEGPDFDQIFELARQIDIGGGRAVDDSAVRDRLAGWCVRRAGV